MEGYIKTQRGDTIKIDYEYERVIDQSVADVTINGEDVSTMIYDEDLDKWYDCLNPGEVDGETDTQCALNMVRYYRR